MATNGEAQAVLSKSEAMPDDSIEVCGYDFNEGVDYHKLLQTYATCGFQSTNFGRAVVEINNMVSKIFSKFLSCVCSAESEL